MIIFDIVTLAVIGWMIFKGQKDGFVSQLLSLVGVVLGVAFAITYGEEIGAMLNIEPQYVSVSGFVIVLFATIIIIILLSKLITGTLSLIKLKWLDSLLGIAFAVVKGLAILGLLYAAIFALNARLTLVEPQEFDKSVSFNIVRQVADPLIEYWNETKPLEQPNTNAQN